LAPAPDALPAAVMMGLPAFLAGARQNRYRKFEFAFFFELLDCNHHGVLRLDQRYLWCVSLAFALFRL
jgi:hypothetical protein